MPKLGLGLGAQKNNAKVEGVVRPPTCAEVVQYTEAATTKILNGVTYLKDKILGRSTGPADGRTQVRGQVLDGDNSRYVEVRKPDDSDFLDTDTPARYKWYGESTYSAVTYCSFFGSDGAHIDRYYFTKSAVLTEGLLRVGFGDPFNDIQTNLVIGDLFKWVLYVDETLEQYTLEITKGTVTTSYGPYNVSFAKGGSTIEIGSRGNSESPTDEKISYIGLINTDTNEEIFNFNFEETNGTTRCYDSTGNGYYGEIQNPTGNDRVADDRVDCHGDLYGFGVSKALGKNLFDKTLALPNFFVNSNDGSLGATGSYYASDYILVEELSDYVLQNTKVGFGTHTGAFYDKDKVYISGITTQSFSIPSNAKWARLTILNENIDTAQLEQGTTPTAYEAYKGYFNDEARTDPIPQGVRLPVDHNGYICAWIDDGGNPPAPPEGQLTVTVSAAGNGTVTVNGDSSYTGDYGDALTFVATPDYGNEFVGWSSPVPATLTMDRTYVATFQSLPQYTIAVQSDGNGQAFVNGQTGSVNLYEGEDVGFTYIANEGYSFVEWTPELPDTAEANGTYTVHFEVALPDIADNGDDYENWTSDTTATPTVFSSSGVELTLANEQPDLFLPCDLSDDYEYELIFNIAKNTLDTYLRTSNFSSAFSESVQVVPAGGTGEFKTVIRTGNPISNQRLRFRPNAYSTGELDFTFSMRLVDEVEPPSGSVNVRDYGATGNGSTDDTQAFRDALAVGDIYIPPGTYRVTNIIVPSNRTITGADRTTSIVHIHEQTASNYTACFNIQNKTNVILENFTIDMTPDDGQFVPDVWDGLRCAYIRYCTNVHVNNVTMQNNEHGCVYIGGNSYLYFDNCRFINVDTAINSDQSPWYDDHVYIDDCYFDGHYYSEPVYFDRCANLFVRDCTMKNKPGGSAIRMHDCSNITITNNNIDNLGNGLYIIDCDTMTITGNVVTNWRWDYFKNEGNTNITQSGNSWN
jgi:parallel beta-helix repeat protein